MLSINRNVISDEYFEHEMDYTGFGFEFAQEWNFYPFYWADNWGRGFGFYLAFLYQYRPLDNMGDLDDASGFGFMAGFQYKWDFGRPDEIVPE